MGIGAGEKKFRADQIWNGFTVNVSSHLKRWPTFPRIWLPSSMTSLWSIPWNNVLFKESADGTVKYLLNCLMVCWLRQYWCVNTTVCQSVWWRLRLAVILVCTFCAQVWLRNNVTSITGNRSANHAGSEILWWTWSGWTRQPYRCYGNWWTIW